MEKIISRGNIDRKMALVIFLAVVAFCLNVFFISVGWDHTILGPYDFRQTQTAISTYYLVHLDPGATLGSAILTYQTPVLGMPWSIPFEFPVFQTIVAIIVRLFPMDLDIAGRLVSIFFFYLSLPPMFFLSKRLFSGTWEPLIVLCFCLLNPVFLFWSRTFMIESAAFFFGISFLATNARILSGIQNGSIHRLRQFLLVALATLFGALCGLTKATTFGVFCVGTVLLYFRYFFTLDLRELKFFRKARDYAIPCVFIFGIALIISLIWVKYSDVVKMANPMARDFIDSKALRSWNFGYLGENIVFFLKGRLFENAFRLVAIVFGLIFFKIGRKHLALGIGSLLVYISGPVFFPHLYIEHMYYWYANTFFLLMFVSASVSSALEATRGYGRLAVVFMAIGLAGFSFYNYLSEYYPNQENQIPISQQAQFLRNNTSPDTVVLIYGEDWSSVTPYYSQRKALMDRWNMPVSSQRFIDAMKVMGAERIGAMVVPSSFPAEFIDEKVAYFGFSKSVGMDGGKKIYFK